MYTSAVLLGANPFMLDVAAGRITEVRVNMRGFDVREQRPLSYPFIYVFCFLATALEYPRINL